MDGAADKLVWSPNGGALAIVDRFEGGASVWLIANNQIMPVDPAPVSLGLADTLSWSPGDEVLPLLATSPQPSLWVVSPGVQVPAPVNGSALSEGAAYVTRVWWGYGIHWTPSGWLYNVAGRHAVRLEVRGGRALMIGTDEPDALKAAIDARLAARGR